MERFPMNSEHIKVVTSGRQRFCVKARPPEFPSTHPAPESRIENFKHYIPEALPYYQKSR